MTTMYLYHISKTDLGSEVLLKPRVPKHKDKYEDNSTPRICCCPTIPGCIHAIPDFIFDGQSTALTDTLYVYSAYVPVEYIVQPTCMMVCDSWFTGELWVTHPGMWYKVHTYKVWRQARLAGTPYSRFIFHDAMQSDDEIVCDRKIDKTIYGEPISFSMLELDYKYAFPDEQNVKNVLIDGVDPGYADANWIKE